MVYKDHSISHSLPIAPASYWKGSRFVDQQTYPTLLDLHQMWTIKWKGGFFVVQVFFCKFSCASSLVYCLCKFCVRKWSPTISLCLLLVCFSAVFMQFLLCSLSMHFLQADSPCHICVVSLARVSDIRLRRGLHSLQTRLCAHQPWGAREHEAYKGVISPGFVHPSLGGGSHGHLKKLCISLGFLTRAIQKPVLWVGSKKVV